MNRSDLLEAAFSRCAPLFRDTQLSEDILQLYKVGLFLREPTYCDATYKMSGYVAPHRFLIISSHARCLDEVAPNPWGMCLWQRGAIFKIIDHIRKGDRAQITLLEIPEHLLDFFCNNELNELEESFVVQSRETFEKCIEMQPLPEINTDKWRQRLIYPVGIDDGGDYFPLFQDPSLGDEEHAVVIQNVLHHQGQIHMAYSDYSKAGPLLLQALSTSDSVTENSARGRILVTLADLYSKVADLHKAEATLFEAYAFFKKIPHNENRLAIAMVHARLGNVYQSLNAESAAEKNYLHALKIMRRLERKKSVAVLLSSLGALYEGSGRVAEARSLLQEAYEIECAETGDCKNPALLNNIARLAHVEGQHAKAIEYLRVAVNLIRQNPSVEMELQAAVLYNLAECYASSGAYETSLHCFQEGLDIDRYLICKIVSFGSERQRQQYIKVSQFRIHQCISLLLNLQSESQSNLEFIVQLIFERKSLALDVCAQFRQLLVDRNDPATYRKLEELRTIVSCLAFETLAGPGNKDDSLKEEDVRLRIEKYSKRRELLESELARNTPASRIEKRLRSSNWRDVAKLLPQDAVLLEYFRLDCFDFLSSHNEAASAKYLAVIIAKSMSCPKVVDLGDAEVIDREIGELRLGITGGDRATPATDRVQDQASRSLRGCRPTTAPVRGECLRRLIFDPIADALQHGRQILIAPDGDLCRLPFEILPLGNGKRLIDDYQISYLTSGNDLLMLTRESLVDLSPPLVIADPDFNLASAPAGGGSDVAFENLEGSRAEGEEIASMLGVGLISRGDAVEGVIRSCTSPSILHLATHGFVLEFKSQYLSPDQMEAEMTITSDTPLIGITSDEELLQSKGEAESHSVVVITPARMKAANWATKFARLSGEGLENPMLRSGIALAGANTWLRGQQLPNEGEDGILTAEEVVGLNLTGTELVVLSACETGLGDISNGEGVLGLRRSFVLAGARTLVISLWKVPDVQTKELMVDFYRRVVAGEGCSAALRKAQLKIKERYSDPFYWGAFICQGDPGPIRSLESVE